MKTFHSLCLLLLSVSANLSGMDQPATLEPLSSLPEEILYNIIDRWPATNVYRLISKRWHFLTSYEKADDIVGKLGPASLGKQDAQKLLLNYILQNDLTRAHQLLRS